MPQHAPDAFVIDVADSVTFSVDRERRTITGLALPFGDVAESGGRRWRFSADSNLTWPNVKFLDNHNWGAVMGAARLERGTDQRGVDGLIFTGRVKRGPAGDELLELASDDMRAVDGLSIGLGRDVKATLGPDGVHDVISATIVEVSTTPLPSFTRANITSVAASAATGKDQHMPENQQPPTDGADTQQQPPAAAQPDPAPAFSATDGQQLVERVAAIETKVGEMATMRVPVAPGAAQFSVREEPIYRFSGTTPAPSGFDFATDLLAAVRNGDRAALERVQTFTAQHLGPQFVDTADVNEAMPATYRPDMFLGQAPVPTSPLYDTFYKGGLSNVQPFYWSKLDRGNTDVAVADHTEGTEPTATDLVTTTGATVTPAPVSGKVHITREVGDVGGNPNVSGLVWSELDRSFRIALETKTAALLAAAAGSVTDLFTVAAGADGTVLGQALETGLIGLQFIADGARFTKAFGHVDLYTALASEENTDGTKRYPIINPQNRSGISGAQYSFIDVAGYRIQPAHSLGATSANASDSWLVDPAAVYVWNSGLMRLEKLGEDVEGWDLGAFAYFAGIVYDTDGLRTMPYDPTA